MSAPRITTKARPAAAKPAPAPETLAVRVRATRVGYSDERRRRPGDVFVMQVVVKNGNAELPSWVEPADKNAPIKETGAQAALNTVTAEARALREGATPAVTSSNGDDLGI